MIELMLSLNRISAPINIFTAANLKQIDYRNEKYLEMQLKYLYTSGPSV